jgi:GDP-fucose protein O-fucosyltransferase
MPTWNVHFRRRNAVLSNWNVAALSLMLGIMLSFSIAIRLSLDLSLQQISSLPLLIQLHLLNKKETRIEGNSVDKIQKSVKDSHRYLNIDRKGSRKNIDHSQDGQEQQQKQRRELPKYLLNCSLYGGPMANDHDVEDILSKMVYWRSDILSDATYVSPFYDPIIQSNPDTERFLLWDVDPAGFNNKRMSFENFLLLAHAMGRTLVMPPKGIWVGFSNSNSNTTITDNTTIKRSKNPTLWSMEDFFDLQPLFRGEQAGLKIISMERFLQTYALPGKLFQKSANQQPIPLYPPDNRTVWDGFIQKKLKAYLSQVTTYLTWRPESCLGAFTAENSDNHRKRLNQTCQRIINSANNYNQNSVNGHDIRPSSFQAYGIGNPTPVNASIYDRMKEKITSRKQLCFYSPELQKEQFLYYKIFYDQSTYTLAKGTNIRLLIHFYSWFFFEDWHQDLWAKRFLRDRLRYKDELQCAAARIVHALHKIAKGIDGGNFDTIHIRRDSKFREQYGTLTTAEEIVKVLQDSHVHPNQTVYIATDETNSSFFIPLQEYFHPHRVWFLHDFYHLIPTINVNYYSIIDQLVAMKGKRFFGAFCSTFTGYINRIRGYQATKFQWEGHYDGKLLDSYLYNYKSVGDIKDMQTYQPPEEFWFLKESAISWRDMDHDVS